MTPTPGKLYTKNGYTFRVDFVDADDIKLVRWKGDEEMGSAMSVAHEVWADQMADAVEVQP